MRASNKTYYVYILTNKSFTLYTGVTNNLQRRVWEHKNKLIGGFTNKYNIDKLVYFEEYNQVTEALNREKQVKSWTRQKRIDLIKSQNPTFEEIII